MSFCVRQDGGECAHCFASSLWRAPALTSTEKSAWTLTDKGDKQAKAKENLDSLKWKIYGNCFEGKWLDMEISSSELSCREEQRSSDSLTA